MRKFLILAGMLSGFALLSGTPAKAELGCECVKLGQAPICVSGISTCMNRVGGVCVAPCSHSERKVTRSYRVHKVAMKAKAKAVKKEKTKAN